MKPIEVTIETDEGDFSINQTLLNRLFDKYYETLNERGELAQLSAESVAMLFFLGGMAAEAMRKKEILNFDTMEIN